MSLVCGQRRYLDDIKQQDQSFFVSLTFPRLDKDACALVPRVVVGSDAVELRVDLLEDRSPDSVTEQISLLRHIVKKPIIFTLRSESQGGKFPDHLLDEQRQLYRLALRVGVEFLDVEVTSPDDVIQMVTELQRHSQIIASHHDPAGNLSWRNASWIASYNRALQFGNVIKLVGVARNIEDNFDLARFKSKMLAAQKLL